MNKVPIKATCLSPLQYHSVQAARGTKTAPIVGDIALSYALNDRMGILDYKRVGNLKPHYEELMEGSYLSTVLYGEDVHYLPTLTRNTMQGIEVDGSNRDPRIKESGNMYSNFFFIQPINAGSTFKGFVFTEDGKDIPPAVRVGNQLQCLLKLEIVDEKDVDKGWVNLYTLQHILGHEEVEITPEMERYKLVHQYDIVKNVPIETIEEWYKPFEK